jgi:RNA polymerase sigma-70 factor (ECF subfamily)
MAAGTGLHGRLGGPSDSQSMQESLSLAFLLLLEKLTPGERAAFLLHEVFDYDHAEVAEMLGKTEANCRQLLRRARQHITDGRSRFILRRPCTRSCSMDFCERAQAVSWNNWLLYWRMT